MKVFLMYPDQDLDLQQKLPWNELALIQDLELNTLLNAMALGDKFLWEVAHKTVLLGLQDLDNIGYRQNVLRDCLKNTSVIRDIYEIAVAVIEAEKKIYLGIFTKHPSTILHRSIDVLQLFVGFLTKLKLIAEEHDHKFDSEGFSTFFAMIKQELDDQYFASIENHLRELRFRDGVLISAKLGKGNKGINYTLHRQSFNKKHSWIEKITAKKSSAYSFSIADRDEVGARALLELKDRGINQVANALAQSADHILSFVTMLRTELAFYMGCLNLQEQLACIGQPVCFPVPVAHGEPKHSFTKLYDVCLALNLGQSVVGNTVNADEKDLVIITGANQGGKSTFLRSIGLSQLMMQCGMFVPAESFCANVCDGLFTHYKREEDATMNSGKLDEELHRMSDVVDHITAKSLLLFNESFAATNEREGSEIARQIIYALLEKHIKVFFVTHLYDLGRSLYDNKKQNLMFLRSERRTDGKRTFRIIEGEPFQTSYGEDLYKQIFG